MIDLPNPTPFDFEWASLTSPIREAVYMGDQGQPCVCSERGKCYMHAQIKRAEDALEVLRGRLLLASNPSSSSVECPYCDGRGWNTIAVHDPTDPDGEPLPEQEQCATCGGSGEVSSPAKERP